MKLGAVVGRALLLVVAQGSAAEERFYPIVGPDGSIRVIRSKMPPAGAAASAPVPASAPTPAASAPSSAPAGDAAEAASAEKSGAPAAAGPAFAPYDSDEYADSDAVEQAVKAERPPSRFYLIQDGMGQHTLSEGGKAADADNEPASRPVAAAPEQYRALTPARREFDHAAGVVRYPGLAACLPAQRLKGARPLEKNEPEGLVLDRQLYNFLEKDRVAAVYKVGSEGLRTLALKSYARKDSKPAFADPDLVLLDAGGCMTRMVSGYYERLYAATDKRHAMLSAELDLHADESYLLVLAPVQTEADAAASPFARANIGQLKFTLKK